MSFALQALGGERYASPRQAENLAKNNAGFQQAVARFGGAGNGVRDDKRRNELSQQAPGGKSKFADQFIPQAFRLT